MGEMREVGNVVVCYLFFGWVVFGVVFGKQLEVSYVYYIKFEMFIDMIDFWIMESMGVFVKFCNCEVGKFSQIEREEVKIIEEFCEKIGN